MLRIKKDIEQLKEKHVKICKTYIQREIDEKWDSLFPVQECNETASNNLKQYLKENLKQILSEDITALRNRRTQLNAMIKALNMKNKSFKKNIFQIIDYEKFSNPGFEDGEGEKWGAYEFVKEIGLKTCPYCNSNYIPVIRSTNGKMRPQIDHFLNKSSNPLFALSFFNLIPSCYQCNHIKSTKNYNITPHEKDFGKSNYFELKFLNESLPTLTNKEEDLEIEFVAKSDPDTKKQVDDLMLRERYAWHKDVILDLIKNHQIYNKYYIKSMSGLGLYLSGLSEEDIYRMMFNVPSDEEKYHERPLSKLINDVINQLNNLN